MSASNTKSPDDKESKNRSSSPEPAIPTDLPKQYGSSQKTPSEQTPLPEPHPGKNFPPQEEAVRITAQIPWTKTIIFYLVCSGLMTLTGLTALIFAAVVFGVEYPFGFISFIFVIVGSLLLFVGLLQFLIFLCKRNSSGWHYAVLFIGNVVIYISLIVIFACLCCGKGINDHAYFAFCYYTGSTGAPLSLALPTPSVNDPSGVSVVALGRGYYNDSNNAGTDYLEKFIEFMAGFEIPYIESLISSAGERNGGVTQGGDLSDNYESNTYGKVFANDEVGVSHEHPGVVGYSLVLFLLLLAQFIVSLVNYAKWVHDGCCVTLGFMHVMLWSVSVLFVYGALSLILNNSFVNNYKLNHFNFGYFGLIFGAPGLGFLAFLTFGCMCIYCADCRHVWETRNKPYPFEKKEYAHDDEGRCERQYLTMLGLLVLLAVVGLIVQVIITSKDYVKAKNESPYPYFPFSSSSSSSPSLSLPEEYNNNNNQWQHRMQQQQNKQQILQTPLRHAPSANDSAAAKYPPCLYSHTLQIVVYKSYIGLLALSSGPVGLLLLAAIIVVVSVMFCCAGLMAGGGAVVVGGGVVGASAAASRSSEYECSSCHKSFTGSESECPHCLARFNN